MKNFLTLLLAFFLLNSCVVNADEDFNTPVPSYDDEVTSSGPDTKLSLSTQLLFDAFENAEKYVAPDIPEERKEVKLYKLSKSETYMQRVRPPRSKVIEYTNGSFDIYFKDTPLTVYKYNQDGVLTSFGQITNKAKAPCVIYYYDTDGQILEIEIKPEKYRSYVYDLNGILTKYVFDDKTYSPQGKLILRRKSSPFWAI